MGPPFNKLERLWTTSVAVWITVLFACMSLALCATTATFIRWMLS